MLSTLLELAGFALVVTCIAFVSWVAAIGVAGVMLVAAGVALERRPGDGT